MSPKRTDFRATVKVLLTVVTRSEKAKTVPEMKKRICLYLEWLYGLS